MVPGGGEKGVASVTSGRKFDLDNPRLPAWVAEGALKSGGYPYDEELKKKHVKKPLQALQEQLVVLQRYLLKSRERVLILFEGRDSAGKGGAIETYREHLNPRNTISIALAKPSDHEQSQWYFQRYAARLPAAGETVLFDRSWYNRGGIESVMGFATPEQVSKFLEEAPAFERMIVNDGIHLFKFWLSIGREMQLLRFHERRHDPLKSWKISPIDIKAIDVWDDYTAAIARMLPATDTAYAPWTVVLANDHWRARLEIIRTVLGTLDYEGKDENAIGKADPRIRLSAEQFLARSEEN
jgi:polyphosphate kinase 2